MRVRSFAYPSIGKAGTTQGRAERLCLSPDCDTTQVPLSALVALRQAGPACRRLAVDLLAKAGHTWVEPRRADCTRVDAIGIGYLANALSCGLTPVVS